MPSRITTPFGARSTAAEVIAGVDLSGQRAIVTGGASGIGVETARALASANAEVTLAVRNLTAGRAVAGDIAAGPGTSGSGRNHSIWPIRRRSPRSRRPGPGRCTSWSTTPA